MGAMPAMGTQGLWDHGYAKEEGDKSWQLAS